MDTGKQKFEHDRQSGEAFELRFMGWANRAQRGCWYEQSVGNFKDWDLHCPHCGRTVECKSDRLEQQTKNYCFELPLLQASKADILAYETFSDLNTPSGFATIFVMRKLREWCRSYYADHRNALVSGGDRGANKMLLVPRWKLQDVDFKAHVHLTRTRRAAMDELLQKVQQ